MCVFLGWNFVQFFRWTELNWTELEFWRKWRNTNTYTISMPAGNRFVRVDKLLECMVHVFCFCVVYTNICWWYRQQGAFYTSQQTTTKQRFSLCCWPLKEALLLHSYFYHLILLFSSCQDFMGEHLSHWIWPINIVIDTKTISIGDIHKEHACSLDSVLS